MYSTRLLLWFRNAKLQHARLWINLRCRIFTFSLVEEHLWGLHLPNCIFTLEHLLVLEWRERRFGLILFFGYITVRSHTFRILSISTIGTSSEPLIFRCTQVRCLWRWLWQRWSLWNLVSTLSRLIWQNLNLCSLAIQTRNTRCQSIKDRRLTILWLICFSNPWTYTSCWRTDCRLGSIGNKLVSQARQLSAAGRWLIGCDRNVGFRDGTKFPSSTRRSLRIFLVRRCEGILI